MGLSRRQYAVHRGVSHTAVGKAIRSGRITLEPDGTLDPAKADRQWAMQTDPAKQRGVHAEAVGASPARAAGTKPVPHAAISAVNETLREHGADPDPSASDGAVSYQRARVANEVIKAQTNRVKLAKMKGDLIDRARATLMVFDLAQRERDAWQNWPPRVAANMAADLGVEPHKMEQILEKYLREHLADLGEVKVNLG